MKLVISLGTKFVLRSLILNTKLLPLYTKLRDEISDTFLHMKKSAGIKNNLFDHFICDTRNDYR